jgi:hypothetical protein
LILEALILEALFWSFTWNYSQHLGGPPSWPSS